MFSVMCVVVGDPIGILDLDEEDPFARRGFLTDALNYSYMNNRPAAKEDTFFEMCDSTKIISVDYNPVSLRTSSVPAVPDLKNLREIAYGSGNVFIIVFSLIDKNSFRRVNELHEEIIRSCQWKNPPIILVGLESEARENEGILQALRKQEQKPISPDEGQMLANKLQISKYLECSVVTNRGVEEVFFEAVRQVRYINARYIKPKEPVNYLKFLQAAQNKKFKQMKKLYSQNDAVIYARDEDHNSVLHICVQNEYNKAVEWILANEAKIVELKNKKVKTAFDLAVTKQNKSILQIIKEKMPQRQNAELEKNREVLEAKSSGSDIEVVTQTATNETTLESSYDESVESMDDPEAVSQSSSNDIESTMTREIKIYNQKQEIKCVVFGDDIGIYDYDYDDRDGVLTTTLLKCYETETAIDPASCFCVSDNYSKKLMIDEEIIDIGLWNTAGQNNYYDFMRCSLQNADVVIIVFSLIESSSLDNITALYESCKGIAPTAPFILVGMEQEAREDQRLTILKKVGKQPVSYSQGLELAKELGINHYLECSVVTREGVDEVFMQAAKAAISYASLPIFNALVEKDLSLFISICLKLKTYYRQLDIVDDIEAKCLIDLLEKFYLYIVVDLEESVSQELQDNINNLLQRNLHLHQMYLLGKKNAGILSWLEEQKIVELLAQGSELALKYLPMENNNTSDDTESFSSEDDYVIADSGDDGENLDDDVLFSFPAYTYQYVNKLIKPIVVEKKLSIEKCRQIPMRQLFKNKNIDINTLLFEFGHYFYQKYQQEHVAGYLEQVLLYWSPIPRSFEVKATQEGEAVSVPIEYFVGLIFYLKCQPADDRSAANLNVENLITAEDYLLKAKEKGYKKSEQSLKIVKDKYNRLTFFSQRRSKRLTQLYGQLEEAKTTLHPYEIKYFKPYQDAFEKFAQQINFKIEK